MRTKRRQEERAEFSFLKKSIKSPPYFCRPLSEFNIYPYSLAIHYDHWRTMTGREPGTREPEAAYQIINIYHTYNAQIYTYYCDRYISLYRHGYLQYIRVYIYTYIRIYTYPNVYSEKIFKRILNLLNNMIKIIGHANIIFCVI